MNRKKIPRIQPDNRLFCPDAEASPDTAHHFQVPVPVKAVIDHISHKGAGHHFRGKSGIHIQLIIASFFSHALISCP